MKLAIRIKHHPLATRVDRTSWLKIMQVILNDSRAKIYYDSAGNPYKSVCGLLEDAAKDNPTHLLVLEDDVLPCFNYIPTVEKLIKAIPDEPITFFTNSKISPLALTEQVNWIKLKIWYYTQSYIMPFGLMKKMISWIDENVAEDERNSDDERMAMYFYYHNRYVYATAPSLVEHIGWNSSSLKNERPEDYMNNRDLRMASKFIGVDKNPLEIDWIKTFHQSLLDENDYGGFEDYHTLFQKHLKPSSEFLFSESE